MIDADAERLGNAVGGDVVMGRADAAGGEDIGVARTQRVQRGDDIGFVVGDDTDFLEVDPDIGQVLGDEADVLVLGPSGQDFVADHQNTRGDDVAHDLSLPSAGPLSSPAGLPPASSKILLAQPAEVTWVCRQNKHRPAEFSGTGPDIPGKCPS